MFETLFAPAFGFAGHLGSKVIRFFRDKSDFRLEGAEFLERNDLTYRDLLARLIGLDHATIPDLSDVSEGSVDQWAPVFRADTNAWRLATYKKKLILGYFSAFSLTDTAFAAVLRGEVADSELTVGNLRPLDKPGRYKLYVCTLVALSDLDRAGTRVRDLVVRGFFSHLKNLAKQGIIIDEVCTCVFSEQGKVLTERLGMHEVREVSPKQGGILFHYQLNPPDKAKPSFGPLRQLQRIYQSTNVQNAAGVATVS